MKTIGPYKVGEIPDPLLVDFTDIDGQLIDLSGWDAIFVWEHAGTSTTRQRGATIVTVDGADVARHVWAEGDIALAGTHFGEMWVQSSAGIRYASRTYTYEVEANVLNPFVP